MCSLFLSFVGSWKGYSCETVYGQASLSVQEEAAERSSLPEGETGLDWRKNSPVELMKPLQCILKLVPVRIMLEVCPVLLWLIIII